MPEICCYFFVCAHLWCCVLHPCENQNVIIRSETKTVKVVHCLTRIFIVFTSVMELRVHAWLASQHFWKIPLNGAACSDAPFSYFIFLPQFIMLHIDSSKLNGSVCWKSWCIGCSKISFSACKRFDYDAQLRIQKIEWLIVGNACCIWTSWHFVYRFSELTSSHLSCFSSFWQC